MASYLLPPLYAAFVWWFSTGAVLLLVGMPKRFDAAKSMVATCLAFISLFGMTASANGSDASSAYIAFTCAILLWGAQEIAFLGGWLTGPRTEPCPADARGLRRFNLALQTLIYHEGVLIACGLAIAMLTWRGVNQVAFWTFAALWVLRQSAKLNLFFGVPVTNDELMPDAVAHLKSYFARGPVSFFFPLSVTASIATLVIMIQRVVEVAASPFDIAGLTLVSTLFALGVLEHWFMLLPLPAVTLWGWGMRTHDQDQEHGQELSIAPVANNVVELPRPKSLNAGVCARQRLEDQFRKTFLEQNSRGELATAHIGVNAEPAATGSGRPS